jgi:polysaccharide export outer membrane protein
MKRTVLLLRAMVGFVLFVGGVLLFTGCQVPQPPPLSGYTPTVAPAGTNLLSPSRLRVGELLVITFADVPTPIPQYEGRIREDGKITLTMNQEFVAAGRTVAELEKEIRDRYVPKYFQNLTVTVRAPERFFYVDGQVRLPSRQQYLGEITLLGAIAAAGGFTDFAQPKKVRILRADGKVEVVDCKRAQRDSRFDVPIYPGDRIIVPRRFW